MRDPNQLSDETYKQILVESLTVVALLSLLANAFVIFTIVRYKKLREVTTNLIFLVYNILQVVILLATPLAARIVNTYTWSNRIFCTFLQINVSAFLALCVVLVLLICDSNIKLYHENKYQRFSYICKFIFVAVFLLTAVVPFLTVSLCLSHEYAVFCIVFFITGIAAIVMLFLIFMNIVHCVKKRKLVNYKSSNIGLVVPNIFFLSMCPVVGFYVFLILHTFDTNSIIGTILLCLLVYSNPIINLIYVFFCDSDYKAFMKLCFTCRCSKKYENLTFDRSVTYNNDVNGVLINQN